MKLSVILPAPFQGGVMRSAMNICRMLTLGARAFGDRLDVSFGFPHGLEFDHDKVEALRQLDVHVRPFLSNTTPAGHISAYYSDFIHVRERRPAQRYIAFNDGVSNFEEADLWLIISDHIYTPVPPHRRYAVVVYDYVQKYCPDILCDDDWITFATRAQVTCDADFVITTSEQTRKDAISFAGVAPARVHRLPVEFDPPRHIREAAPVTGAPRSALPYIMWPTILSQHENHLAALAGLSIFLESQPHQLVITGFHTKSFDPGNEQPSVDHPYVRKVRSFIEGSPELQKRITFKGFVSDAEFARLMQGAAAVLHTSTGDNGTYTALEAAWLGVQTVCSRYPAMEQLANQFELPLVKFDIYDTGSLIAALRGGIQHSQEYRQSLPTHEQLARFRFDRLAPEYWLRFKDAIAGAGLGK